MGKKIICNTPNRLRVRYGKYIFTKEQGFSLKELLLERYNVQKVEVNYINGSVMVEFNNKETKIAIMSFLSTLKVEEIIIREPSAEQHAMFLEKEFKMNVINHCAMHYIRRLVLPNYIRDIYTIIKLFPYIKRAIKALISKKINVEVLDAVAISSAILSGNIDTASSTMFLLELTELFFKYSKVRAKSALVGSLKINVDKVWKVVDDVEIETNIKDIRKDDVIRLRQGTIIPVDGTVINGDALVNEAPMTGEPIAIHKTVDGIVFAGTIIEDGEIDIKIISLNKDSRMARIMNMIDEGENEKANIQGNAEKLADDIVPISFGLFFTTLLLTRNLGRALSVLMVDFSCAIKLTTPITIISALKESVNNDVLIKGGKYLEIMSEVDTVVFDKTGTLTNAVPKISKIISTCEKYSEEDILKIAACLEEHFPHSIAAAMVEEAKKRNIFHPENHGKVEYIVAHGIASSYGDKRTVIGSKHFVFEDEGVEYPQHLKDELLRKIGSDSSVYLAMDGKLIGVVCVNDPPKDEAKLVVEKLRQHNIKNIYMLTGDNEASAKFNSDLLGLDGFYAGVLPDGKVNVINNLKKEGKIVLMVGDGINDAPALTTAQVSIALNSASDIAREAADISILNDDLMKIVYIRDLSEKFIKKVNRQYKQIVVLNTSFIVMGMLAFISPMTSARLHNSTTMILSALSTRKLIDDSKKS